MFSQYYFGLSNLASVSSSLACVIGQPNKVERVVDGPDFCRDPEGVGICLVQAVASLWILNILNEAQ